MYALISKGTSLTPVVSHLSHEVQHSLIKSKIYLAIKNQLGVWFTIALLYIRSYNIIVSYRIAISYRTDLATVEAKRLIAHVWPQSVKRQCSLF